jgi:hypothetical protein
MWTIESFVVSAKFEKINLSTLDEFLNMYNESSHKKEILDRINLAYIGISVKLVNQLFNFVMDTMYDFGGNDEITDSDVGRICEYLVLNKTTLEIAELFLLNDFKIWKQIIKKSDGPIPQDADGMIDTLLDEFNQ